jgi:hypothetical protein
MPWASANVYANGYAAAQAEACGLGRYRFKPCEPWYQFLTGKACPMGMEPGTRRADRLQPHREGAKAPVAIQARRLDCFVAALLAMTFPKRGIQASF